MRTLTHLTRSHSVSVVLLNVAVSSKPFVSQPAPASDEAAAAAALSAPYDRSSIFASVTLRPALGKTFPYFLDLHLFVSTWPGGRDEEELRGDTGNVHVIEVLVDVFDGRLGRWAPFLVEGGCKMKELKL